MRLLLIGLVLVVNTSDALAQILLKGCTLDAREGLVIQAVDEDWNPVPFDCANTRVLIESDSYRKEIKPGQYRWCPAKMYPAEGYDKWRSMPAPVLGETPGTFQVTVIRFDQVSTFRQVIVPLDERGCHVVGQTLEVMQH
jgi:hypothetical protein